jgi:NH3-dependent NAD+ synthetase
MQMQKYNMNHVMFLSGLISEEQLHEMELGGSGMAPIDSALAKRLAPHYMDPVSHLERQADSLQLTDKEMQALDLIKRASQRVGINLQSGVINITHAVDYMNLLSQLQKGDLRRIANYIDRIRMGVYEELAPYIKKASPNASFE